MIGAGEHMLHATRKELPDQRALPTRRTEARHRLGWGDHARVRDAVVERDVEQAAVIGVDLEQRAIPDIQPRDGDGALERRVQHRIAAVAEQVHQVLHRTGHALRATGADLQARQGVCVDLVRLRSQFAPGDLAVVIRVEPDRFFKVAQRNGPAHARLITAGGDRKVT